MRHDVVKELSTVGKLHDEIDLLGRVHHLVQMHDILVGDALENQDLPADPLDVGDLNDAMLFQNLHSDLLARQNVRPELDLALAIMQKAGEPVETLSIDAKLFVQLEEERRMVDSVKCLPHIQTG